VRGQLVSAWSTGGDAPSAVTEWRSALQRSERGGLLASLANVVTILTHDRAWAGLLAWCELSTRPIKRAAPPWSGPLGEWDETDSAQARLWLSQHYGLQVGSVDLHDAVLICAHATVIHPVREYLSSLRWDGECRLPTWLHDYLDAEESDYTARVGTLWMISAIARVMQPPCKADGVLILEGGQGLGKSTALHILAGEWFSDTPLDLRHKDAMQGLAGSWIVELAELESLRGATVERANAFLSSSVDHYRPAYGRQVGRYPRQCIFAGTTNPDSYLNDPTGARRYWPVQCGWHLRLRDLQMARDQLWAEAMHRWRAGEHWWPETAERELFAEEQERRYHEDPWEEIIARYLEAPAQKCRRYFTIADALSEALQFDDARIQGADGQRVGRVFQRLGWQKVRLVVTINGERRRRNLYQRPEVSAADEEAARGDEGPRGVMH
jgi:putative DNA primase/helicase